ncbi:MAG TPA: ATP-binding protein [Candidatus Saccharimonadales bacterium]|jgi:SpoVK/Ycf46/Vps4 family AAA+-type ATPase
MNTESVINLAKLGLSGDKVALLDYLKFLAADSANKKKISLYHGLVEIIESQENQVVMASGYTRQNSASQENLWFNKVMQKRLDKLVNLCEDPTMPASLKGKFNKILLYGPPGTGKTTVGFYIAQRLNRKLEYVKVSDVISFKFGETLKNMANIFEDKGNSIIFIDEFDAFAKSRSDTNDVGELKRIVNSLIQTLDVVSSDRIVIVATNLVDTIDPAILRRFPIKLNIPELTKKDIKDYVDFLLEEVFKEQLQVKPVEKTLLVDLLFAANLRTVDAIKGVFESAQISIHINKKNLGDISDILEAATTDGILTADIIKKIHDTNPEMLKKLMTYLTSNVTKSDVADFLGIHRNSLINYAK